MLTSCACDSDNKFVEGFLITTRDILVLEIGSFCCDQGFPQREVPWDLPQKFPKFNTEYKHTLRPLYK